MTEEQGDDDDDNYRLGLNELMTLCKLLSFSRSAKSSKQVMPYRNNLAFWSSSSSDADKVSLTFDAC